MKLTFGKYKDKTITWVKNNDPNYYEWGCVNIPDIFNKPKKPKKEKEVILSDEPILLNMEFNKGFKWHDSYPKDMTERMYKWFKS